MTEVEVPKLEIAREYLDRAIEFFLAGTNYFSAIHLSAAAEELPARVSLGINVLLLKRRHGP